MRSGTERRGFVPSLCVTHNCNLNCTYCYQKHDNARMAIDTAKPIIDWIFDHIPEYNNYVEICFIGGEPLLEFELLKEIVAYTCSKKRSVKYVFFATTNGTLLTEDTKAWFTAHKDCFVLGLSLDGAKETHDYNRSNSFDDIDIGFFLNNWPEQGIKMTLSEFSLPHLSENIKYLHSLGFKEIAGVNLAEGNSDWSNEEYIKFLVPQLKDLVDFYLKNDTLELNQMLNKRLNFCERKDKEKRKWCGVGTGCIFFDVDGKKYPCTYITPMTFNGNELADIMTMDFTNDENFIDDDCFNNCYIYPICPTCAGACYTKNKTFKKRDKSRCILQKLITLFIAELQAKRIVKNPKIYDDYTLYHTIEAIRKIRSLYLPELETFLI